MAALIISSLPSITTSGNIGGALSVTILNVDVRRAKCATLEAPNRVKNLSTIVAKKEQACLSTASRRPRRLSSMCLAVASKSTSAHCEEAKGSVWETVRFTPSSSQVESLVTDVCDTTSIAEFELDFGGFRLYLKRGLEEAPVSQPASQPTAALPAPPSPPVVNSEVAAAPTSISAALTLSKSKPGSTGIQRFVDSASDEGLAILQSPKVGFFRRSRMIKGKRAPPSCQEKQVVKEGQVLCFIEQLGGEIPIESDVSGEVIKILRKDGEPVGYGDALIAVLPSFPGIKKLQL